LFVTKTVPIEKLALSKSDSNKNGIKAIRTKKGIKAIRTKKGIKAIRTKKE
jgi:hypothetical protein